MYVAQEERPMRYLVGDESEINIDEIIAFLQWK
jgi:hypothetical protein